jgi:hypothetical protein
VILSGRYGEVSYDPTGVGGATLVAIVSLNKWKLSFKTDKINVTCFQDTNKVYVPGMKDVDGTVSGFWNSDDTTLFDATDATTPGLLQLVPNTNEATFGWKGLAYLDADIDTGVDGAPAVSGTIIAAGPWSGPSGLSRTSGAGPSDGGAARIAALERELAQLRRAA